MKDDHRVRLTKMLLHDSMLELMKDRPAGKVTVKELCEKAGVNRATFYAHYPDTYALLDEIQDMVTGEILHSFNTTLPNSSLREFTTEICRCILKNRRYCEVLFGKYGDESFLTDIIGIVRAQSIESLKKTGSGAQEGELERLFTFLSNGCVAVVRSWVQEGMTAPPEEIADFMEKADLSCAAAF